MTSKYHLYLSGPIEGIPPQEAKNWRYHAELSLPADTFECLNPMDWSEENETTDDYFRNDIHALQIADAVLINLTEEPKGGPLRGTTWEAGYAFGMKLPTYIVYKDSKQRERLGPFFSKTNWGWGYDLPEVLEIMQTDCADGSWNHYPETDAHERD